MTTNIETIASYSLYSVLPRATVSMALCVVEIYLFLFMIFAFLAHHEARLVPGMFILGLISPFALRIALIYAIIIIRSITGYPAVYSIYGNIVYGHKWILSIPIDDIRSVGTKVGLNALGATTELVVIKTNLNRERRIPGEILRDEVGDVVSRIYYLIEDAEATRYF